MFMCPCILGYRCILLYRKSAAGVQRKKNINLCKLKSGNEQVFMVYKMHRECVGGDINQTSYSILLLVVPLMSVS